MDDSWRYPGAVAKVPIVSYGLHCARNWSRAFDANSNDPADAARDSVLRVAGIRCRKTGAPSLAHAILEHSNVHTD